MIFFLWNVGNLAVNLDPSFTIITTVRHLLDLSWVYCALPIPAPAVLTRRGSSHIGCGNIWLTGDIPLAGLPPGLLPSDLTYLLPPVWACQFCWPCYLLLTLCHPTGSSPSFMSGIQAVHALTLPPLISRCSLPAWYYLLEHTPSLPTDTPTHKCAYTSTHTHTHTPCPCHSLLTSMSPDSSCEICYLPLSPLYSGSPSTPRLSRYLYHMVL